MTTPPPPKPKLSANHLLDFKNSLIIGLLITSLFIVFLIYTSIQKTTQELNKVQEELLEQLIPKQSDLFEVLYSAGYGGFIHNFKNFILRGDLTYADDAAKDGRLVLTHIDQLISKSDPAQKRDSKAIKETFESYLEKLDIAVNSEQNLSISELDAIVTVDDSAAKQGLENYQAELAYNLNEIQANLKQRVTQIISLPFLLVVMVIPLVTVSIMAIIANLSARRLAFTSEQNAKQAFAAKEAQAVFLSNMSHEIRTPMNGVSGMLHLLSDSNLDIQQRQILKLAQDSATSLMQVINDILDLSKIEANKLELHPTYTDLETVMTSLGQAFIVEAESKGLEFICPTTVLENCQILIDPLRLRQILNNLVSNAIKFTDKGYVSVSVSVNKLDNNLKRVEFKVEDTGIGISEENQSKLFARFEQIENSFTRTKKGSGLGLAICDHLAELMHANLYVESVPQEGTCFTLSVDTPYQNNNEQLKTRKINKQIQLYAFARPQLGKFLRLLGSKFGLDVNISSPFDTTLQAIKQSEHSIAMVEISMLDNDQLSRLLKFCEDTNRVIFIQSLNDMHRVSNLPCCKLNKPICPSEFFNIVQSLTGSLVKDDDISQKDRSNKLQFNASILVVEDDEINQQVISTMLKKYNIKVDIAENGQVAVSMIRNGNYDLVFMDVMMPVMDGLMATKNIRDTSNDSLKNIPIIALTADAMSGSQERCMEAGMNDFITKPIQPNELRSVLSKWLAKHRVW